MRERKPLTPKQRAQRFGTDDWTRTPEGLAMYQKARKEAQAGADLHKCDYGLTANNCMKAFSIFMLPAAQYRGGTELRCEVVHPSVGALPGHGPEATRIEMQKIFWGC